MEFDKTKYVVRGVPLVPNPETAGQIYGALKFNTNETNNFRNENPHLGNVLECRANNIGKNLKGIIWKLNPEDIISIGERNFRVYAALVYQGLYMASENCSELSPKSGLPILTEKDGKDLVALYKGIHMVANNSNELLIFLRNRNLYLSDLISMISSDYENNHPINGREFESGEPISCTEFIKQRGELGAQTLYQILEGRNHSIKLSEEFGL